MLKDNSFSFLSLAKFNVFHPNLLNILLNLAVLQLNDIWALILLALRQNTNKPTHISPVKTSKSQEALSFWESVLRGQLSKHQSRRARIFL